MLGKTKIKHRGLPFLGLLFLGLTMSCTNTIGDNLSCQNGSDCPAQEDCIDGICTSNIIECQIDADCESGVCIEGACRIDPDVSKDSQDGGPVGDPVFTGDGVLRITPEGELDFGSPVLGVALQRVVQLINQGDGILTVNSVSGEPGLSEEFTWVTDPELPVDLEPEENVELTVYYTLADGEEDVGTLYIDSNAASCEPECDDPSAVPLELFSEFKGARNLSVTPEEYDFGYVPVGTQSSAHSLILTNDGTLDKVLTIESIDVTSSSSAFEYTLPTLPLYLSPGASHNMPVVYNPLTASMSDSVSFTVTANSDDPQKRILTSVFYATSQPPNALVFDPYELVFPEAAIGQVQQLSSTLRNEGGVPITVTSLDLAFHQPVEYTYFASVSLPYTLAPNASLDVYVDFTAVTGDASATTLSAQNNQASGDVPVLSIRGESYIPPGGPILDVSMGPETVLSTDCGCQATGNIPAANVDISYQATPGGPTCSKPDNPSCGIGGTCPCSTMASYGDVNWGGSRIEEVRGETWIIDEKVHHDGDGLDGEFLVKANLLDNCLAVPGSTAYSVNHACCMWVDCEEGPQSCFDYGSSAPLCANMCEYLASQATSQDCLARGSVAIRTSVRISGDNFDETRDFCVTLAQNGDSQDVVTLTREAGYFQISAVSPGVTEVSPGQPCP